MTTRNASVHETTSARPLGRHARSPEARLWRWYGRQLDPRKNSLNLIRLTLSFAVLFHHTWPLGGFDGQPSLLGVQPGAWAVFGFFCISGYLITGSRLAKPIGAYLTHRIARIYPAFWVCLAITAAVFAPLEYARTHATLDGYLTAPGVTPLDYLVVNATLQINSYGIGQTLASTPYPAAWNGSLWTLYYEFGCYLIIGALAFVGWWRRYSWPVLVAFILSVAAFANVDLVLAYVAGNPDVRNLLSLLPFFLGGAFVYKLRKQLPLHWTGALVCGAGLVALLHLSTTWGLQLGAPLMTYLLLWLGHVIPSPQLLRRNDISYGVYIYAFPVQQLLASFGVGQRGVAVYMLAAIALTVPFAILSWLAVERPMMRRARRGEPRPPANENAGPLVRSLAPSSSRRDD